MYFITILLNNSLVLLIYSLSGLLVKILTKSKLAPYVPWAILLIHAFKIAAVYLEASLAIGFLPCLAFVLPHGLFEIPALVGGCIVGTKLAIGQRLFNTLGYCWLCIFAAAVVEAWITPFPFQAWVSF